jgi:hypothetical protein
MARSSELIASLVKELTAVGRTPAVYQGETPRDNPALVSSVALAGLCVETRGSGPAPGVGTSFAAIVEVEEGDAAPASGLVFPGSSGPPPGFFAVSTRPGLGFEVDHSRVRHYQVRQEEFLLKTTG